MLSVTKHKFSRTTTKTQPGMYCELHQEAGWLEIKIPETVLCHQFERAAQARKRQENAQKAEES